MVHNLEVIVKCKRQIGLAAAKINDPQRTPVLPGKIHEYIPHKFEIPVDLPELVVLCLHNLPLRRLYAEFHEKRHRHILRQDVLLLPVVGKVGRAALRCLCPLPECHLSLFAHKHCHPAALRLEFQLPEIRRHHIHKPLHKRVGTEILMVDFRPHIPLFLVKQLPFPEHRPYAEFVWLFRTAAARIAHRRAQDHFPALYAIH